MLPMCLERKDEIEMNQHEPTERKIMSELLFNTTASEMRLISKIANRVVKADGSFKMDVEMDLTACHSNGCKLDFKKLFGFEDFDFFHDVYGISKNINRETGHIGNCFLPRSAA